MGCGSTLALTIAGRVICDDEGCPNPDAAAMVLDDGEAAHIAVFAGDGYTIRHPLRERIGDALMTCTLHEFLRDSEVRVAAGRYRVTDSGASATGYQWEKIGD